jgi:anthranilate/para-aminobenzoate synthase component I
MSHPDARHLAREYVGALETLPQPILLYGTSEKVQIVHDAVARFEGTAKGDIDLFWRQLDDFLVLNKGRYVAGFIGFDPANSMAIEMPEPHLGVDLFAVDKVETIIGDAAATFGEKGLSGADVDVASEERERYREAVAEVISMIRAGQLERLTLARKLRLPGKLDLFHNFTSDYSAHPFARSFYFSNEAVQFAGQSPELLCEGDIRGFSTHKLSGTRSYCPSGELKPQIDAFLTDEKLLDEHRSSSQSVFESLRSIGYVDFPTMQIMQLPTLLHGWSHFRTRPKASTRLGDCLRSIFPYGARPYQKGLELIKHYENGCRGPYYGLVGLVDPNGHLSFTQVLRSGFSDREGSYLMAGAAITMQSEASLELDETHNKLSGIPVKFLSD